jgi:hypothetical protein
MRGWEPTWNAKIEWDLNLDLWSVGFAWGDWWDDDRLGRGDEDDCLVE